MITAKEAFEKYKTRTTFDDAKTLLEHRCDRCIIEACMDRETSCVVPANIFTEKVVKSVLEELKQNGFKAQVIPDSDGYLCDIRINWGQKG